MISESLFSESGIWTFGPMFQTQKVSFSTHAYILFFYVTFQTLTETQPFLWSVIIIYKRPILNMDVTSK